MNILLFLELLIPYFVLIVSFLGFLVMNNHKNPDDKAELHEVYFYFS